MNQHRRLATYVLYVLYVLVKPWDLWNLCRRGVCVWVLWLSCMLLAGLPATAAPAPERPNVVIIYADDLGYGDVQCYNTQRGRIPTPHMDRLAAEGLRFTDAHSSSGVCSPSRYTLLTGRYHWRTRLQQGIVSVWEVPLIAPDRLTLAGLVRQRGYHTACVGKWHLGWEWPLAPQHMPFFRARGAGVEAGAVVSDAHRAAWQEVFSQPIGGGPVTRGFDVYFGTDVPNWPPYCFVDNDRTVGIPSELLPADLLTDHLASLPGPALPGWRLEAILPALADRACALISEWGSGPEPFLLYLPLTSPHTPLAVNEPWRGKSGLDSAVADLVMETDAVVGRVLDALDHAGIADRTLVLFTSDNGFAPYCGARELESRGHFPSGPWRGYKGDAWEGGHRVPFIVRWPGVVNPGGVSSQLVHQADVMATLAEVLNVRLPADAGEDSVSLLPLLRGDDRPVREHAISQGSSGTMALRQGLWKLLAGPTGGGAWSELSAEPRAATAGQLYHLENDPGETHNLFAVQPQRAAQMLSLLHRLVRQGRSTPGIAPRNDVDVDWQRFLRAQVAAEKPRVFVLTDIANEPDDEESLVRFLVYANEFQVEGLVATTSTHLRETPREDLIRRQLAAFDQVHENLLAHAWDYPTAEQLSAVTATGQTTYGMGAVGDGQSTAGSRLLLQAADRADERPLWITVWGGANTLAQALWDARREREPEALATLVRKLRVYTISDQDDAGPWLRREFPELFYIVSPSTTDWKEYWRATWTGISGDRHYRNAPFHQFSLVDNPWLEEHIIHNHGPLGALYPKLAYIMEGDTPSFLGLVNNGLGWAENPAYGGWGGRYVSYQAFGETRPIWTNNHDSRDTVTAENGQTVCSDQATIWRWREHFQHDFAARMDWCVAEEFEQANHNPVAVLHGDTTRQVLQLVAKTGETVHLSADGSSDPDGDAVRASWFVYREAGTFTGEVELSAEAGDETSFVAPSLAGQHRAATPATVHVILVVEDTGTPKLWSYRRAVITLQP